MIEDRRELGRNGIPEHVLRRLREEFGPAPARTFRPRRPILPFASGGPVRTVGTRLALSSDALTAFAPGTPCAPGTAWSAVTAPTVRSHEAREKWLVLGNDDRHDAAPSARSTGVPVPAVATGASGLGRATRRARDAVLSF